LTHGEFYPVCKDADRSGRQSAQCLIKASQEQSFGSIFGINWL
jgi:hypothetical protein